jgi:hypothetical protein
VKGGADGLSAALFSHLKEPVVKPLRMYQTVPVYSLFGKFIFQLFVGRLQMPASFRGLQRNSAVWYIKLFKTLATNKRRKVIQAIKRTSDHQLRGFHRLIIS